MIRPLCSRPRVAALMLAGLMIAGPLPARAADITADTALAVRRHLRDWLASLLGPRVDIGEPFRVTPDGDHYALEVTIPKSLAASAGFSVDGDPLKASLAPLSVGRWRIDEDQKALSARATTLPPPSGQPAATGTTEITVGSQVEHGTIDPSLATPSDIHVVVNGYHSSMTGAAPAETRTAALDELASHLGWKPAPDGRLDVTEDSEGKRFASKTTVSNLGPLAVAIEQGRGDLQIGGLAPDPLAALIRAAVTLAPAAVAQSQAAAASQQVLRDLAVTNREAAAADRRAGEEDRQAVVAGVMTDQARNQRAVDRRAAAMARYKAFQARQAAALASAQQPLSPDQKAAVRGMLRALPDLLDSFDNRATFESMIVSAAGGTARLDKAAIGLAGAAPAGRARLQFALSLDGLTSPDIPAGIFRDDLPRHVAIALHAGGVPSADLREVFMRAAASDSDDPRLGEGVAALVAASPIVIGLDDLSLDVGPATLKGRGEARMVAPGKYEGEAHFVAIGLDALIKQATASPEMARVAPILFLLKGLGKDEGASTVWNVTFRDGHTLVNGADVAGLLPHR